MPIPPNRAAQSLYNELVKTSERTDLGVDHWKSITATTLVVVDDAFNSALLGDSTKLSLAATAMLAVIIERNAAHDDALALRQLYQNVIQMADRRPAVHQRIPEMQEELDAIIEQKSSLGLPVAALEYVRHFMVGTKPFQSDIRIRGGGAKPLNDLFARVMYVVLYRQCKEIGQRRRLEAEARQITRLLPSQLSNDRANLPKLRVSDRSLDHLFLYARSEWLRRRSLALSDYVSN